MGHPLNCLAWLAGSSVAAAFGGLKAGQVVMLGSVTPPIWLTGPASVTVDFTRCRRCRSSWPDAVISKAPCRGPHTSHARLVSRVLRRRRMA